jgi:hypothetical protein
MSSLKFACAEVRDWPKEKGVEEEAPPRQAYSHSASVGKRYTRPNRFSSGISDSLRQKAKASSQDTFSTGKVRVSWPTTLALPPPRAEK